MELVIAAWLLVVAADLGLEALEARHIARHGHRVPVELEAAIEPDTLARMVGYARDRARLRLARSIVSNAVVGLFLFGGGLAALDRGAFGRCTSLAQLPAGSSRAAILEARAALGLDPHLSHALLHGLVFVAVLVLAGSVLELPFGLWGDFRIEVRHGFSRTTPRLWIADRAKGVLLSIVLGGAVASAGIALVWWSPGSWWIWVWAFLVAFSIFLVYISPYAIEPLFFRFEPVAAPELEARLRRLVERAGLRVSRVLQVDASRRSRHSNAYFTGIGRVKRIVLFDTLLELLGADEIEAVVAHEIGHWTLHHVLRRLVVNAVVSLGALWIASLLAPSAGLPRLVGMEEASFPARAAVLAFVRSLLALPLAPLTSGLSRRDERAADRYATLLTGRPGDLAAALARLARDNLANLHPHPLYAWFFHSHPPVVERIRALRATAGGAGS